MIDINKERKFKLFKSCKTFHEINICYLKLHLILHLTNPACKNYLNEPSVVFNRSVHMNYYLKD